MAKKEKRKDNKGRVLQKGESQRQDGTYDYRYTNRAGERKCLYAPTLAELRKKEEKLQAFGISDKGKKITVENMVEIYLKTKRNLAVSTVSSYNDIVRLYIAPSWFGKLKLADVIRSDILNFYCELYDKGLSIGYIEIIHNVVNPAFKMAVLDDLIRKNPCTAVLKDFKGTHDIETVKDALTIQQQEAFLNFAKTNVFLRESYYIIIILIESCLRISELFGLRWKDVSFEKNEIDINHQLIYGRVNGKFTFYVAPPKNKSSIRKVPLTIMAKKSFAMLKKIYSAPEYKSDAIVDGYSDFIFRGRGGGLLKEATYQRTLTLLTTKYNAIETEIAEFEERDPKLMPNITPHTFRHTGCTRLADAGIDPKVLQELMGHANVMTTMKYYNHNSKDRIVKEMIRIGKFKDIQNETT